MTNKNYAYIAGKHFSDRGLTLILRYLYESRLRKIELEKECEKYKQISGLPLETLIEVNDDSVRVIAESDIANRTNAGDFQSGTIRDYLPDDDQENRHLLLRDPLYFSIQRLRDRFHKSLIDFFTSKNMMWVAPSILTKATEACEDISSLFWTQYQNKETKLDEMLALVQTTQLHLEAMCSAFGGIYSIAPSFRQEQGLPTLKHLLEYWHIEAEMVDTPLEKLMDFVEEMLKHIIEETTAECQTEIDLITTELGLDPRYPKKILGPYERITYDQALERLNHSGYINKKTGRAIRWGEDLDSEAERRISVETPVFVYNWPDELKAFYFTRFVGKNGKIYAKSFDLIGFHHGEIVGAGEREFKPKEFKKLLDRQVGAIRAHGHDPKDYKYYEDLRVIGTTPHSGFGIGLERALAFLYNLDDVRMASLFPRDQKRVYP